MGSETYGILGGYVNDLASDYEKPFDPERHGWDQRRKFYGAVSETDNKFRYTLSPKEFREKIPVPFENSDYVPNRVQVRVDFDLATSEFFFLSSEENLRLKFKIEDIVLYVPECQLNQQLYKTIRSRQEHEPIKFYFKKIDMEFIDLPNNTKTMRLQNVNIARTQATRVILGIQPNEAQIGSYKTDPMTFSYKQGHSFIESIKVFLSNQSVDSWDPISDASSYISDYFRLFQFLGYYGESGACNIDFEKFKKGAYFKVQDLSTSLSESHFLRPVARSGPMQIVINFSKEVKKDLVLMALFEIPTSVSIYFE